MDDPAQELVRLRSEIDAIDDEIGALLARRFARTDAVGVRKALVGETAVDARRQLQRVQVLQELAHRHAIPIGLVQNLFGRIKDEVVARHRARGCRDTK